MKKAKDKIGAVMVIGGGVAGVQACLDLADIGYYVYLVENSSAIGGRMAQLDKIFPTNDCAMCILSPKLVECSRHPNIKIFTLSKVKEVIGEEGNFEVKISQYPRYIDINKCIACGICASICPKKVKDEFNQGLNFRKAAYIKYPQAVPLKYAIDPNVCIKIRRNRCGACEKKCPAKAIDFNDKKKEIILNVGSIILATGFVLYNPNNYEYLNFPNVITSIEFERILSASGPHKGHMVRPSDKKEPDKIAWIQCVGSRNIKEDKGYCSTVCCAHAIKQAIIAKEHSKKPLDTAIFFMDMRTYGKGFEKYYDMAREEGVRFIRSRIHTIERIHGKEDLQIKYIQEGKIKTEIFDMVILSVGLEISKDVIELANKLGIELNDYNFVDTNSFEPLKTSRPGVYVCGVFQAPKDIRESVTEASAAACYATIPLKEVRGSLIKEKTYPEERILDEEPRIGVFICHCGINIGGIINVAEVRDYAKQLPHVVYAEDNLFTCSQDTQEKIKDAIKKYKLNRVVVAACSPRTHEPLFQETMKEAGLNKYLFCMTNIRDQCSWVHMNEPEKATKKAKDLLRMAVAKVALQTPLKEKKLSIIPTGLVVGGGVAGMEAALGLAEQGFKVYLIEKTDKLGGQALKLTKTWKGEDIKAYLDSLIKKVSEHELINVYFNAKIKSVEGFVGNFKTTIEYNGVSEEINHGVIIIATGAKPYRPKEYLYGKHSRVMTLLELDEKIREKDSVITNSKNVVFIQCVGSRNDERPYCSRVCCTHALQTALKLKKEKSDMNIFILYRDIMTYGFREPLYRKARTNGIVFIRYEPNNLPKIEMIKEKGSQRKVRIKLYEPILKQDLAIDTDIVVLSEAIVPNEENKDLSKLFKVSLDGYGFFAEGRKELGTADTATSGIFICGLAQGPKFIDESITQAKAAVTKAVKILSKKDVELSPIVAQVIDENCDGCGYCIETCPFHNISLIEYMYKGDVKKVVEVNTALCQGCGICQATCPKNGIFVPNYKLEQISAMIDAALES